MRTVTSVNGEQISELLIRIGCERDVCDETIDLIDADDLRQLLEMGEMNVAENVHVAREPWEVGATTANVGEKLSDLVNKRNTIAHGNGKVSLSKGGILEALSFFRSFASLLQEAVLEHLRETLTLG
jgi:hypothetical protein